MGTTRNLRTSSVMRTNRSLRTPARRDFSSWKAIQTLAPRNMKPNKRRLKPSSLQLCRRSIKPLAVLQEECQVVCQAVVCQIWAPEACLVAELQTLETSMISTEH